jgi:hypothetical protein
MEGEDKMRKKRLRINLIFQARSNIQRRSTEVLMRNKIVNKKVDRKNSVLINVKSIKKLKKLILIKIILLRLLEELKMYMKGIDKIVIKC